VATMLDVSGALLAVLVSVDGVLVDGGLLDAMLPLLGADEVSVGDDLP